MTQLSGAGFTPEQILEAVRRLPAEMQVELGFAPADVKPEPVVVDSTDPLSSPLAFALAHSRGRLKPYRWIRFLNDQIMEFLGSEEDLLFVTAPPRHGKSQFLSVWVPAWYICKYKLRVAVSSYGDQFAAKWGREVRDIIQDVGGQYGVTLRQDSQAANRWDLEGYPDGGMFTAGAGGVLTGKGFHLGICDDPIKDYEASKSALTRDKTWDWWKATWLTRREPMPHDPDQIAKMILLHTRWNFDDLGGRILADDEEALNVRHIDLPAFARDDDPMGRAPGEPLCPERGFTRKRLEIMRRGQLPRVWNALYQQTPGEDDGDYFKGSWFNYFTRQEDEYILGEHRIPKRQVRRYQFLDTAYTRTKRSDYTVLGTFGVAEIDGVRHLLVLDVDRRQVESTEHSKMILEGWNRHDPVYVGIEKITATMSLLSEMQRYHHLVVRPLDTKGDPKAARAETAAIAYETGRIWHPGWSPAWLEGFEKELLQFDKGAHDDQVDVISYAARDLLRGVLSQGREKKQEPTWDGTNTRHLTEMRKSTRHKKRRHHPILGRF